MSDDKQVNQPKNDVQEAEVKQTQTDEKPTPTFNQEDVDRIVKQRLEAEKSKHQRMLDEAKKKEEEIAKEKQIQEAKTKADLEKYYYRNSRFWSVIYDKYRNCYYRLVLSPIELMKYEQGVRNMKVSILVLNNKFEKLGEVLVDNVSYNLNTMFVNEQGINILSRTKYRENPSRFTFDIFEPIIEKR